MTPTLIIFFDISYIFLIGNVQYYEIFSGNVIAIIESISDIND